MSLSIADSNGSHIYFDVVRAYSKRYRSQATQNPVDGSGNITDNITKYNPVISIRGIITGADFNSTKPLAANAQAVPTISVSYNNNPAALLPDVIGQFFTETEPTVTPTPLQRDSVANEKSVVDTLLNYRNKEEIVSLTEFNGDDILDQIVNCVIVELSFEEQAEIGDAIQFELTLEVVNVVTLSTTKIPKNVQNQFATKAAGEVDGGSVTLKNGEVVIPKPTTGLSDVYNKLFSSSPKDQAKGAFLTYQSLNNVVRSAQ